MICSSLRMLCEYIIDAVQSMRWKLEAVCTPTNDFERSKNRGEDNVPTLLVSDPLGSWSQFAMSVVKASRSQVIRDSKDNVIDANARLRAFARILSLWTSGGRAISELVTYLEYTSMEDREARVPNTP
jgi:hypothetical protein